MRSPDYGRKTEYVNKPRDPYTRTSYLTLECREWKPKYKANMICIDWKHSIILSFAKYYMAKHPRYNRTEPDTRKPTRRYADY